MDVALGKIRLTGGEARGSRIYSPTGLATRPALAKVRAAIFNILGDVEGAVVLDLFAGTGALGFEALSRGASEAIFFESDPRCVLAMGLTSKKLGMTPRCRLVAGDVYAGIAEVARRGADVAFVDPPYALIDEDRSRPVFLGLLTVLGVSGAVRPGGIVVVEHRASTEIGAPDGLDFCDRRTYGQTALSFLKAR